VLCVSSRNLPHTFVICFAFEIPDFLEAIHVACHRHALWYSVLCQYTSWTMCVRSSNQKHAHVQQVHVYTKQTHTSSDARGDRDLMSGVGWRLMPGDRVGLVGPNGAGKSTLLSVSLSTRSGLVHTCIHARI
jgi:ABC-type glutathione transport system ATPase component